MERISVFSLCSIFLLISYCGCPSGAKKKKDLETIVEVIISAAILFMLVSTYPAESSGFAP